MKAADVKIYLQPDGDYSFLPFKLPERRVGHWQVVHQIAKKGTVLPVVSWRNAIFMGLERAQVKLEHDTIIHHLEELEADDLSALGGSIDNEAGDKISAGQGSLWMSTRPQEIEQAYRQLERASGSVLVGGLGLGLAVGILHNNPKVKTITVIENSEDVIALVKPFLPYGKTKVIHDDLYNWLKSHRLAANFTKYDFAFYDVWCGTGEYVFETEVLPLRRLSMGIVDQANIECWNEEEMIGQYRMGLHNWVNPERKMLFQTMTKGKDPMELTPAELYKFVGGRTDYPFLAWMHLTKPPQEMAEQTVERFLAHLRDPERYGNHWKAYENYGKEAEKAA